MASAKEEAEANLRELENVRGQLEQDRETALRELEEQKQRFGIPDHPLVMSLLYVMKYNTTENDGQFKRAVN